MSPREAVVQKRAPGLRRAVAVRPTTELEHAADRRRGVPASMASSPRVQMAVRSAGSAAVIACARMAGGTRTPGGRCPPFAVTAEPTRAARVAACRSARCATARRRATGMSPQCLLPLRLGSESPSYSLRIRGRVASDHTRWVDTRTALGGITCAPGATRRPRMRGGTAPASALGRQTPAAPSRSQVLPCPRRAPPRPPAAASLREEPTRVPREH